MPSSVVLTLDTHAPSASFGDPTGTTAGEFFQLPYTSDEPLDAAELRLADGRHFELTVDADILSVLLPADTIAGPADIWLRDEVWNARTYPAAVLLQGVPWVAPPATTPGRPGGGARRRSRIRRRIGTTSRVDSHGRSRVRSRGAYLSSSLTTSGSRISRARVARSGLTSSASSTRVSARAVSSRVSLESAANTRVRRGDGPDTEAAILLDLW